MPQRHTRLMTREPLRAPVRSVATPDMGHPASEPVMPHRPVEDGQFRLQVDRQTKAYYATFEAAKTAGLAIKKGHPNLHVAVHDGAASVNTLIELPGT